MKVTVDEVKEILKELSKLSSKLLNHCDYNCISCPLGTSCVDDLSGVSKCTVLDQVAKW